MRPKTRSKKCICAYCPKCFASIASCNYFEDSQLKNAVNRNVGHVQQNTDCQPLSTNSKMELVQSFVESEAHSSGSGSTTEVKINTVESFLRLENSNRDRMDEPDNFGLIRISPGLVETIDIADSESETEIKAKTEDKPKHEKRTVHSKRNPDPNVTVRIHSGKPYFECNICKKKRKNASSARMHVSTHTKPLQCRYCSKRFPTKSTINIHENTHTGNMPYTCIVCKKAFTDPSNCRRHAKACWSKI